LEEPCEAIVWAVDVGGAQDDGVVGVFQR
jgi:hypothetical protein